jgi:glycine cleavage system H protein
MGITNYAQDQIGEILYLDQITNRDFYKGEPIGELESPKAVCLIYSPANCTVNISNTQLEDDYSPINKNAQDTWIYQLSIKDKDGLNDLMNEEEYRKYLESLKLEQNKE